MNGLIATGLGPYTFHWSCFDGDGGGEGLMRVLMIQRDIKQKVKLYSVFDVRVRFSPQFS